jgi:hypothetical protein
MIQEVYYNLWKDDTLQKKKKELASKFIFTELERQYVSIEDNIDSFAKYAHGRLGEIYSYIIIGYKDGGNWTGLLDLFKRRLDFLLTDYINRLVASKKYEVDEIIDEMEKWIDTTTEVVSGIIEEQKEDVTTKGATKGTINPTTTKKRIEALDSVRDALIEMLEAKQTRFLHDLPEMDFAEIGPDAQEEPAPKTKPGKKGRGKPRKAFSEFVVDQTKVTEVIDGLKALIGDKKGTDAYVILAAAVKAGILMRPAYNSVIETFGDLGASSGYNAKMAKIGVADDDLDPLIEQLKNLA